MSLEDDLSCAVCTDVFRDPVLLGCGHSFCRQCIYDHWSSSGTRNCPICRQVSRQRPVANVSLRNTCESYLLREQNTRTDRKDEDEQQCPVHGEKIELFCQNDEQLLCARCRKCGHGWHKTMPLQQAVRQRRGKQKAALRSAEKTLLSLQNGTARDPKISRYIQSQVQETERKIKVEFEKLHQFLRKEEESRIMSLNEEEDEKRGAIDRSIQGEILTICDRIKELKAGIEDDDISFLQNYQRIMNRSEYTLPEQELSTESLIDVSKHLGNLKYQVWEKMKEICPYYPVILNPNTSAPQLSVSDDLTSVTSSTHRQNQTSDLPLHRSRVVLGSVGYSDGDHTWEIEVGKSRHWSLGVCLELKGKPITQPLIPANGFWGLKREGYMYHLMTAEACELNIKRNPEVVRVKLDYVCDDTMEKQRWRRVSFIDASCDAVIERFSRVPLQHKLFPFVIPEDQSIPLRIAPANIILTVEKKMSFMERHELLIRVCVGFVMLIIIVIAWKNEQQGK